jgi:predicted flap endonuclease-1-like 5' DNA nuclease
MAPINAVSTTGAAPVATDADRPATLPAARGGQPDNLKEIKGIGPKMETMLHGMGFFHFDQIAAWSTSELAWVDQNLTGFKGRASRDNWVDQAKILASGGDTAFSKRVEDGDVY